MAQIQFSSSTSSFPFIGNFGDRYFGTEPDFQQIEFSIPDTSADLSFGSTDVTPTKQRVDYDRSISCTNEVIKAL